MVADLAARMAEANPLMLNPLTGKGIVLIDEVDLHLHPLWQRIILKQLNHTFPNIQFIVSTHSPIIVVGASNIAQIVNLSSEKDEMNSGVNTGSIGQVLLSDWFGLQSLFPPEWDDKIKQRNQLLAKTTLSKAEQQQLEELNHTLSDISYLQSPESIKADKLIKLIAEQLKIQL